jgi:D-alanyl-D-alanine carboxypeptidase
MMVTRLAPDARTLFATAEDEARARRSPLVEAEHLLLAMSAQPGTDAGEVLTVSGLTHESIAEALDRELSASLTAAGVTVDLAALGRPSLEPPRRLRLGASFKAAMQRSVIAAAGTKQIRPAHLLLGVLGAQVGTVPRALNLVGIDRSELIARTEQSLAE